MERHDREVNPQRVLRDMDEAPTNGTPHGGVEREGLEGSGPPLERQQADDGGSATGREALEGRRSPGREEPLNSARSGRIEDRPGDRSDPLPHEEA